MTPRYLTHRGDVEAVVGDAGALPADGGLPRVGRADRGARRRRARRCRCCDARSCTSVPVAPADRSTQVDAAVRSGRARPSRLRGQSLRRRSHARCASAPAASTPAAHGRRRATTSVRRRAPGVRSRAGLAPRAGRPRSAARRAADGETRRGVESNVAAIVRHADRSTSASPHDALPRDATLASRVPSRSTRDQRVRSCSPASSALGARHVPRRAARRRGRSPSTIPLALGRARDSTCCACSVDGVESPLWSTRSGRPTFDRYAEAVTVHVHERDRRARTGGAQQPRARRRGWMHVRAAAGGAHRGDGDAGARRAAEPLARRRAGGRPRSCAAQALRPVAVRARRAAAVRRRRARRADRRPVCGALRRRRAATRRSASRSPRCPTPHWERARARARRCATGGWSSSRPAPRSDDGAAAGRRAHRCTSSRASTRSTSGCCRCSCRPPCPTLPLAPSQQAHRRRDRAAACRHRPRSCVQLAGPNRRASASVAAAAARGRGCQLRGLPPAALPSHRPSAETLARLWQRERRCCRSALLVDARRRPSRRRADRDASAARVAEATHRRLRRSSRREASGALSADALLVRRRRTPTRRASSAPSGPRRSATGPALRRRAERSPRSSTSTPPRSTHRAIARPRGHGDAAAAARAAGAPAACSAPAARRPRRSGSSRAPTGTTSCCPPATIAAAARDRRARAPPRTGLRATGASARATARGLGDQRAVRRRERHRQDDGRRGARRRARARPVPDRPVAVVSKYIGETEKNLRAGVRRRRGRRRGAAVRRGRRAVRQAQRGQGQPRPLREHRGRATCCSGWRRIAAWRS